MVDIPIKIQVHKYTGHLFEINANRNEIKKTAVNEIPTIISFIEDDWNIK